VARRSEPSSDHYGLVADLVVPDGHPAHSQPGSLPEFNLARPEQALTRILPQAALNQWPQALQQQDHRGRSAGRLVPEDFQPLLDEAMGVTS
jgi:hypothetical protein